MNIIIILTDLTRFYKNIIGHNLTDIAICDN